MHSINAIFQNTMAIVLSMYIITSLLNAKWQCYPENMSVIKLSNVHNKPNFFSTKVVPSNFGNVLPKKICVEEYVVLNKNSQSHYQITFMQ